MRPRNRRLPEARTQSFFPTSLTLRLAGMPHAHLLHTAKHHLFFLQLVAQLAPIRANSPKSKNRCAPMIAISHGTAILNIYTPGVTHNRKLSSER